MQHRITITTFPATLLKKIFEIEIELPENESIRYIHKILESVNSGAWKVHYALIESLETHQKYHAFSDHAALLYKRKGQIIHYSCNDLYINKKRYRLRHPHNLTIYPDSDVDCKYIRKVVKLI